MRAFSSLLLGCLLVTSGQSLAATNLDSGLFPPNPYHLLGVRSVAPPIDAIAACTGDATLSETDEPVEAVESYHDPENRLAAAILSARNARSDANAAAARKRLAAALSQPASPRTMACGWLELARLELRSARIPEARATALRASRSFGENRRPDSLGRAVSFYRAESLAGSGDPEAALEIYRVLASGEGSVAEAAELRLAEATQTESPSRTNRLRLETLIQKNSGTSPDDWVRQLSEWAIEEGELEVARAWLEIEAKESSPRSETLAAAISFRLADVLYAQGEKNAARKILYTLAEAGQTEAIQSLARVRKIDLAGTRDETALRQLEHVFASGSGPVAVYAGDVLARRQLDAGRHGAALETLVELVHHKGEAPEGQIDGALFDEILTALSSTGSCEDWITTVSGRRDLLLRHATAANPFLRLGDCYRQVGLFSAALETYRGVAKTFGPKLVGAVTLRIAQSEYALGQRAAAHAAAHANVQAAIEPLDAWRLLLARIQLTDGRAAEAERTLRPVLKVIAGEATYDDYTRDTDDIAAILLGAQAAAQANTNAEGRALLRRSLSRLSTEDRNDLRVGEASLIIADLFRQAGALDVARELYTPALAHLERGVLRSRSAYWLGVLTSHPDESRALWSRVAEDDDPWARLAANEIALADGRAAVGEPLAVPNTRRPQPIRGEK